MPRASPCDLWQNHLHSCGLRLVFLSLATGTFYDLSQNCLHEKYSMQLMLKMCNNNTTCPDTYIFDLPVPLNMIAQECTEWISSNVQNGANVHCNSRMEVKVKIIWPNTHLNTKSPETLKGNSSKLKLNIHLESRVNRLDFVCPW